MEQAVGSSLAQRLQQLEAQAEQAAARSSQLEREVLDLTQARAQLAAQLRARKEALELRAGPGDEEGRLQQALDRKRGEVKQLTRETAQLRKEVQELRGRSEQRGGENIGSEKYRLMKRAIRKAAADRITQQLDSLLVEETNEEEEGQEVGVSVDVKPAVLMQAVNMTVFDPSKIFPSTKKEKQELVDYTKRVSGLIRIHQKRGWKKPNASSQLVSSVKVPSGLLPTMEPRIQLLVSGSELNRIHNLLL
ncbi:uncharacterized protein [Blastocystis hominis]|uniref:Uncharacterized protein n=1 Tax=Blastocystis hominis TaxID=12968 RepID=D8M680_BLAHO|nr:uncharacterized protein [Blastocystis hominis]CBK23633.2 unnamed protein product [Blastocystis hominis]|eukprot:XP_012897681.1 uncharacterized protein [Blastocystis hominis]